MAVGSAISGLGSGIDMSSLVAQLMQAERAPEAQMNALRLAGLSSQSAWADIATKTTTLKAAAAALDTVVKAQGSTATSSDATVLTATARQGAQLGQIAIRVNRLASAQLVTSGPLATPTMLVGAGSAVISSGLAAVGASHLAVDGSVTAGNHRIVVTQASTAATAIGSGSPALSYAAPGNDLSVTLADGIAHSVTLGTYATSDDLVEALNTQLGGAATASMVAGQLHLTSRDQGSAASLTLSGGALSGLGLSTSTNGTDGLITVDGGASTAVSHLDGSTNITLTGGFTLTAVGLLTAGTISTSVLQTTGTTTLTDLSAMLSTSGSPVSASVLDTGDGSANPNRFVLSAVQTGSAGALTIDSSGINVLGTGQLTTVTAAADAQLVMGGATITRSSNTISDLLPGVTLNLMKATAVDAPATSVTVARDLPGMTKNVQALVDGLNAVINSVKTQSAYNATTKKGGPLSGDGGARGISDSILDMVSGAAGSGLTKVLSQMGIQTTRDGTLTLDTSVLGTAMGSDPEGVASLLSTFATSVEDFAKNSLGVGGVVTTGTSSAGAEIKARQDQIAAFEIRMGILNTAYSAKFAALDAMLGNLKNRQNQLASQISSL
jgi:flagellar hook-associated protein 2